MTTVNQLSDSETQSFLESMSDKTLRAIRKDCQKIAYGVCLSRHARSQHEKTAESYANAAGQIIINRRIKAVSEAA